MSNIRLAFGAAFTATTAGSTVAAAGEDQMRVSLAGYDLGSQHGAQVALRRIETAAEAFCGDADARDRARKSAQRACVARMIDNAVDPLNATQVTALQGRCLTLPAKRIARGGQ